MEDILEGGRWVFQLTEELCTTSAEDGLGASDIFYDALTCIPTSYFRFYDLPLELRLYILEIYVSNLYPRVVHRCFCYRCEPSVSTILTSQPSLGYQSYLHRRTDRVGTRDDHDAKLRVRFSYCEGLPFEPAVRSMEHGAGRCFMFPYDPGTKPAEPGIFLTCKELRQDVIGVMVRLKPLYVFSQENRYRRYWEMQHVPEWYRASLRYGEELQPKAATLFALTAGWSLANLPQLREVRLNQGRVRMNRKMMMSQEKLTWMPGVPRKLIEGMVSRRIEGLMERIGIGRAGGSEQQRHISWRGQDDRLSLFNWKAMLLKPLWGREWKAVVVVEFRIRTRENKQSKRRWASVHVRAREIENCRTYGLEFQLDDRLLGMERDLGTGMCLVARTEEDET